MDAVLAALKKDHTEIDNNGLEQHADFEAAKPDLELDLGKCAKPSTHCMTTIALQQQQCNKVMRTSVRSCSNH